MRKLRENPPSLDEQIIAQLGTYPPHRDDVLEALKLLQSSTDLVDEATVKRLEDGIKIWRLKFGTQEEWAEERTLALSSRPMKDSPSHFFSNLYREFRSTKRKWEAKYDALDAVSSSPQNIDNELADLRELVRFLSLEKSTLRELECLQAELRPYLVDAFHRSDYILTYGAVLGSRIKGPKLYESSEQAIETHAEIVRDNQAWLSAAERLTRELLMKNPAWWDVLSLEWGNYERNKFGSDEVDRISSQVLRQAGGQVSDLAH